MKRSSEDVPNALYLVEAVHLEPTNSILLHKSNIICRTRAAALNKAKEIFLHKLKELGEPDKHGIEISLEGVSDIGQDLVEALWIAQAEPLDFSDTVRKYDDFYGHDQLHVYVYQMELSNNETDRNFYTKCKQELGKEISNAKRRRIMSVSRHGLQRPFYQIPEQALSNTTDRVAWENLIRNTNAESNSGDSPNVAAQRRRKRASLERLWEMVYLLQRNPANQKNLKMLP